MAHLLPTVDETDPQSRTRKALALLGGTMGYHGVLGTQPGYVNSLLLKMVIEIVDLPSYKMVDLSIVLCMFTKDGDMVDLPAFSQDVHMDFPPFSMGFSWSFRKKHQP